MKSFYLYVSAIVCFGITACKPEKQLDYTSALTFDRPQQDTLIADGVATLPITVTIAAGADPDKRTVAFKTDVGTFTNNSTSISIVAGSDNKATAYLKSTTQGTATITATVSVLSITKTVVTTFNGLIRFTNPATETLAADNYSTLKVVAHINPHTAADKRSVTFTTDLGTFTNNANSVTIGADQNGDATTYFKGSSPGTASLTASMKFDNVTQAVSKNVLFTPPDPDNIFKLPQATDNVPADGVSTVAITAIVNKALPVASQVVSFTTDAGSFKNGPTVAADPAGNATAYLKNTTPGPAHISATCMGITRYTTVNFSTAIPDYMLLSAGNVLTSGAENTLPITITLKRNVGTPSAGFLFDYKAVDTTGNVIGIFTNGTPSDQTGIASVVYSASNTVYKGQVYITVTMRDVAGVKATISVMVK